MGWFVKDQGEAVVWDVGELAEFGVIHWEETNWEIGEGRDLCVY